MQMAGPDFVERDMQFYDFGISVFHIHTLLSVFVESNYTFV